MFKEDLCPVAQPIIFIAKCNEFFFPKIMLFLSMSRHYLALPADRQLWVNFIGRKTGVPSRQK